MSVTNTPAGCRMQLFIKCENLVDADTLSKSDPYCIIYNINNPSMSPLQVGRTEIIKDNLNPVFKTAIELPFLFECRQTFRLTVFDDDGKGPSGDDQLGSIDFQLSQIVTARHHTKTMALPTKGSVTISAVEVNSNAKDLISLKLNGTDFMKMDTFGTADPYFILRRLLPNGEKRDLYRSEAINNTLQPNWAPTRPIKMTELIGANTAERCIEVQCFDKDFFSDDAMGRIVVSLDDLTRALHDKSYFTLLKDHKPSKDQKPYGNIHVGELNISHFPTFADYLQAGWQISLAVSIDFTGSNGDPRRPTSLHYMDPVNPNQYVRAIMSVGEILMDYDTDKQAPVFGFGASIQGNTQHFFHVNQQPNPYVAGVQGILDAYTHFLPSCVLSGPTNFAPTIRSVTKGARDVLKDKCYTVLLIITDGEITDMDATINAVVDADDAPLSIVIVGVGNGCDFMAMDQLDGDGGFLKGDVRTSRRDLVQFVPFRNFVSAPKEALAAEVLREIPAQFELFAELNRLTP